MKMTRKMRIIALLICLILVFTACGAETDNTAAPQADQPAAQTEAAAPAATQAAAPETAAPAPAETEAAAPAETQAAAPEEEEEDMAEIEFYTFTFVAPRDVQHVEDAINAITEEKINTHVHMTVLDIGAYIQQIGIMMAGSERIDLMLSGFATASYSAMLAQHQLMDISDLIDQYGPDIKSTCGIYLDACKMDGKIYATPTYRNLDSSQWLFMRKDVLEDIGMLEKGENCSSVQDLIEILEAVKASEKWNYLHPFQVTDASSLINPGMNICGDFAATDVYDMLGDSTFLIYGKDGKVELNMESESYRQAAALLREMNDKGLIYTDVSGEAVSMSKLVAEDTLFSYVGTYDYGVEEVQSVKCGTEMVGVKIGTSQVGSESIIKFCFEVPITAKEPAAAVKFLNLCYTNAELNNLLAWGVEGVDYEVRDGVAYYIEGNEDPEFHMYDYVVPNGYLLTPWEGHEADFYAKSKEDMDTNAVFSDYLGFFCNLDEVSTEIAVCSSVIDEYELQIKSGQGSEEVLDEFIKKLYDSGVEKIINTYQEQLDAWIAAH